MNRKFSLTKTHLFTTIPIYYKTSSKKYLTSTFVKLNSLLPVNNTNIKNEAYFNQ